MPMNSSSSKSLFAVSTSSDVKLNISSTNVRDLCLTEKQAEQHQPPRLPYAWLLLGVLKTNFVPFSCCQANTSSLWCVRSFCNRYYYYYEVFLFQVFISLLMLVVTNCKDVSTRVYPLQFPRNQDARHSLFWLTHASQTRMVLLAASLCITRDVTTWEEPNLLPCTTVRIRQTHP
jgi:hypothetical protein